MKNAYERKWELAFEDVKEFYKKHGNFKMPRDCIGKRSGINIFDWFRKNQVQFRNGKLESKKSKKLADVDSSWHKGVYQHHKKVHTGEPLPIYYWERGYELAKAYQKEHGCLPLNDRIIAYDEKSKNSYKLGKWMIHQLQRLDGTRKPLPKDKKLKIMKLDKEYFFE